MMAFSIPKTGRIVKKSKLAVWLAIAFKRRVYLGNFGGADYWAFMCPKHGLTVDMEHGYIESAYYHKCEKDDCGFVLLVGKA